MTEMLTFELVSPERELAATSARSVTVPGLTGEFTAMAQHAPYLTPLRPGFVTVTGSGEEQRYFVTGGFAEISDNTLSVLAEEAVPGDEVTAEWLEGKIADAERTLEEAGEDRVVAVRQQLDDLRSLAAQLG